MKTYAANELNQYTAIANPDAVGLRGDATNTAMVTVNGEAASRDTVTSDVQPWHFALPADNANGGEYTFASIVGVVNPPGTNEADIVSTTSGSVYAPPQNETLTYDDDGSLLSDGRFTYTWNGENRLVCAEEQVCTTNRTLRKVDYAYDHQGRMVWKEIKHRDAEAQSWEEEKATSYLWDNFNIIAETVAADSNTNTTYNIWGLDLDGTVQGAGGVGGLLAVVKDSDTYIPTWDGNGNIMEYVSDDGSIVAHREYDPFGGTVVYTEQSAITNQQSSISFTHWFSTKPWCAVTGLSEYQYRKCSPVLGRWLSRDPIGENGGLNLYGFAHNVPTLLVDKDGRLIIGWNTLIGGVVGAVIGGVSAVILEGDVWAGVVNGGVTGALIASGMPSPLAASIGGGLASFVSSYHRVKDYPDVCDSKFGIAFHYTSRLAMGAIGGYYAGVLGGDFSSAMEGSFITQSLTIHGFYIVSTADVVMQGTIDISFTAAELYMISLPEQVLNGALGLEPVIQEYNSQIDILYTETPGKCLCPSEGVSNGGK